MSKKYLIPLFLFNQLHSALEPSLVLVGIRAPQHHSCVGFLVCSSQTPGCACDLGSHISTGPTDTLPVHSWLWAVVPDLRLRYSFPWRHPGVITPEVLPPSFSPFLPSSLTLCHLKTALPPAPFRTHNLFPGFQFFKRKYYYNATDLE